MSLLSMEHSAPAQTARLRGERRNDRPFPARLRGERRNDRPFPKLVPDRRRYRRVPASFHGRFMSEDKREYPCEVVNMSAGGMSLLAPNSSCAPGSRIVAYVENLGRLEGTVARVFEGGFAVEPEAVAANVRSAASTGIAGLSIEDSTGDPFDPLHDFDLAVERVRAARRAIDESGSGIVLTGRSEGFVVGRPDIDETIRRLRAYAEAGADCLFAPRIASVEHVAAVVAAVSPKPVNLLVNAPFITVAEAAALGVRRISVGGTLARTAWAGFLQAAHEIADSGTFSHFEQLPNVDAMLRDR